MDRRSLLRRELLKEQLAQEAQGATSPQKAMSPEEVQAADEAYQKEQTSKEIDAALAGGAQGITMGFSDELGAAKDITSDYLTNNKLGKSWREYQQTRESANKALKEESPNAYMAGEIGAGIAGAVALPSIGAARIAGTVGKLAPSAGKFLAGQLGGAGTRVAGKVAAGAIEGAPIGALYGVGASEHNISNPTELIKDAASGATMGLVTGGALSGATQSGKESIKYAKDFAEDTDFLRQLKLAYDYGTKRLNLGSSAVQDKLSMIPGQRAEDLVAKIGQVDDMLGKDVGVALETAQSNGVRINVDPAIQAAGNKIWQSVFIENPTLGQVLEPKTAQLLKSIAQREVGDLSPTEAKALRDHIYGLRDKLAGFNSDQAHLAKNVGTDLANALDQNLKSSIPEYQKAARSFEEFRRLIPETIISKGTPDQYGKVYMGSLKNPELKLHEATEMMLKKAKLPGEAAVEGRKTFETLRRNLGVLEQNNPKAVKGLGGTSEEVTGKLKRQADELAMIRQAQGFDPQEGAKNVIGGAISGLSSTGRGISASLANKAGMVNKAVGQSAPVRVASKVFNAGNDQLLRLAGKLKANTATSQMGEALERALNNKNEVAKNAVLFKLMQNPEYRNLFKDEEGDSNE